MNVKYGPKLTALTLSNSGLNQIYPCCLISQLQNDLQGYGGFTKTPALSAFDIFINLPYFSNLYLISVIFDVYNSQISPSCVTKKLSAYFWKAIDSDATKNQ